jgi:hypothetical protein
MSKHGNKDQVNLHRQKTAKISLKTCTVTVDGQIKLGQKWQSHKSKFTNLHRLITALSQMRTQMCLNANGRQIMCLV